MSDGTASLNDLTIPIKVIKNQLIKYLHNEHSEIIRRACFGDKPLDELLSGQVEEEVGSLLKLVNRFKDELAKTYTELQYGEPQMAEEDTTERANDHAQDLKEDSQHWDGVELELKDV